MSSRSVWAIQAKATQEEKITESSGICRRTEQAVMARHAHGATVAVAYVDRCDQVKIPRGSYTYLCV